MTPVLEMPNARVTVQWLFTDSEPRYGVFIGFKQVDLSKDYPYRDAVLVAHKIEQRLAKLVQEAIDSLV